MIYRIVFRLEENGDFFEQDFTNKKSASFAISAWRKFWSLHETDCIVFKLEMITQ